MTTRAGEHADYLNIVLRTERWVGLPAKWLLLLLGIFVMDFWQMQQLFPPLMVGVVLYGLSNLVLTYLLVFGSSIARRSSRIIGFASYALDIAFATQVIYFSDGMRSDLYFLYALLALKSVIYYPLWRAVLVFPFTLGPLYALLLRVSVGGWFFLTEPFFLLRYGFLLCTVLAAMYLGWLNERGHLLEMNLRRHLAERNLDLDNKTRAMQQMASSLGNKVLELRTLQEGIKAINSALALEEVLRLIVTNASQVLEGARCSVALLADDGQVMSTAASDTKAGEVIDGRGDRFSEERAEFDKQLVRWMVRHGRPLLIHDLQKDDQLPFVRSGSGSGQLPLRGAVKSAVSSVVGVPLFWDDRVIGALIATSPEPGSFTSEHASLLNAFGAQAAVAVKNARLYEQLILEQRETARIYQHVEERRNELEAILRGIGDGVIVADTDLNLLLMNPVATRIFQVKQSVASKTPLSEVIPHQELTMLFASALRDPHTASVKEIALPSAADRTASTYQALASPILGTDGKPRGVVTVLRDITSQKELERMKSNFLSVVSHELRTPLHSIKGFVEIILMGKTGPINETQADFLRTAREQTAHLQNLINDLLEFSRLESGQVKLRLSEVSLGEVAAAVVEKLKPQADGAQIQLVNRIGSDIPNLEADRLRIEQVLTNLVENAIKFTPSSGVVTLDAQDLGKEIQVTVSDTGIGIPAGELDRIFERFYQVDSGSTRPYRGTGLGLTICKHIVEHHHGRIWAESEPGKGSKFHFVLPKRIAAQEEELLLDFLSLPEVKPRDRRTIRARE